MKKLFTRALLCTSAIVVPMLDARAQVIPADAPPYYTLDGNGVDLATGTFNSSRTDLAIGPVEGGINLTEYDRDFQRRWNYESNLTVNGNLVTVQLGSTTDRLVNGASILGTGATVSVNAGVGATYTAGDGTTYQFTYHGAWARLASVATPKGFVTTFTWDEGSVRTNPPGGCQLDQGCFQIVALRINKITTNRGYAASFGYELTAFNANSRTAWQHQTSATVYNMAVSGYSRTVNYGGTPFAGTLSVTDALSNTSSYTLSSTQITRQLPESTSPDLVVTYSNGRVASVKRPTGTWTYVWTTDGSNNVATATVTDPTSVITTLQFDTTISRATSRKLGSRKAAIYSYNSSVPGQLNKVTTPVGDAVTYSYDGRGNVTQIVRAPGSGGGSITTKAVFPFTCTNAATCNQPTNTVDANNNQTDYVYNNDGTTASVTFPAAGVNNVRPQARYIYITPNGYTLLQSLSQCQTVPSCLGTADEQIVQYNYTGSPNGLPLSVSVGAGSGSPTATVSISYTPDGDLDTVSGPASGMVTRHYYDMLRQEVGTVGPLPGANGPNGQPLKNRAAQTIFDRNGRAKSVQQGITTDQGNQAGASFVALAQTDYTYYPGGQVMTAAARAGAITISSTSYGYDGAGRLKIATLAMQGQGSDRTTTNGYDGNGALQTVTTATGATNPLSGGSVASTATYGYSDSGKLATLKDGSGNLTSYAYDGFDRLQTTTYADGTTQLLGYDAASNVTSKQRRGDSVPTIGLTYDALGRVTARSAPGGLTNNYSYDNLGRLTSATGGTYNVTQSWDALGNLLTDTTGGFTVTNKYDVAGRRTFENWGGTLASGSVPQFFFDYLASGDLAHITDTNDTAYATFTWDDLGRLNGIGRYAGPTTAMTYGTDLRLASIAHTMGAGAGNGPTNDVAFGFNYNPAGQIGSRTTSNDAYVFGVSAPARSFSVNALNQLAPTPTPFSYDSRGNQTNAADTPGASRTFDGLDKVTSAYQGGGTTNYLTYDALDRLAGIQVGAGGAVRRVIWDGQELAGELSGGANPVIYGNGPTGSPVIGADFSSGTWGGRPYYLTDERGSLVTEVTAAGAYRSYAYDAYGQEASTASHPSLIGYAGGIALPGAGLVHFRARAYDPVRGRWVSADPIGVAGGINLYGYANGDPVNGVDPSGLQSQEPEPDTVTVTARKPKIVIIGAGGGSVFGGSSGGIGGGPLSGSDDLVVIRGHRITVSDAVEIGFYVIPVIVTVLAPEVTVAVEIEEVVVTARAAKRGNWIVRQIQSIFGQSCFAAGTLVQTEHGLRAIETIRPGDMVLSRDEATERTGYRRVSAVKSPTTDDLYTVELDVADAGQAAHHADFEATATHPWRTTEGHWVQTADLTPGTHLVRADGTAATVDFVRDTHHAAPTYNLTVEGWHTYFVGKDKVWVHNACPPNMRDATKGELMRAAERDRYPRVEDWKRQELQLNSRDQIAVGKDGQLYSYPRQGAGEPQPLGISVPNE